MKKISLYHLFFFIIILKILFFLISPTFRFGDDIRYLASAKTIYITGDALPKFDVFANNLIWYPPLILYILSSLFSLSLGKSVLWFVFSKLFEFSLFLGSLIVFLKILDKLKFSKKEKIFCISLFSLYPISMFLSTSVMLDFPLLFFTLLLLWFLFFDKNYFISSIICGLIIITKSSGILVVISSILSVLIFEKNKGFKLKYIFFATVFSFVVGGFWFYNNYLKLGTLLYDPWTLQEVNSYQQRPILSKLFFGHLSFWGIPPSYRVSTRLNVSDQLMLFLEVCASVFLIPITVLILCSINKNYKKNMYLLPFIIIFFVFAIYYFFRVTFSDISRYVFPIFPILCIFLSKFINLRNIFFKTYFYFIFIFFILISFLVQLYMFNKENNILNDINNILNKRNSKQIFVSIEDKELIWIINLYYNIDINKTNEFCSNPERINSIYYCEDKDRITVFRRTSIIDYGETLISR